MAKGGEFERTVAKRLSLWYTNGDNDNVFWRTSNSGGRATVRARKGKTTKFHCGDLAAVDPIGQPLMDTITWELKRGYNGATIHALVDRDKKAKKQTYEEWIAQATASSSLACSFSWMIVHKRDRREAMAFMPRKLAWALDLNSDVSVNLEGLEIEGIAWERWLADVTPEMVIGLGK